ncbi:restriction endonuclease subunit S [Galbibacter sp. BG1]|uniref:restriction endonuclease subunit S n=1 Tax=Galbibacter sp. BG1 TaxID=1170699 RepID=UPI0015BEE83F|nr:restriction endonuclease subunit S [Galbibacter sp. BG1]QLE00933.1 restriction endonuclease subunit S [Galbibacter sp. BG1]
MNNFKEKADNYLHKGGDVFFARSGATVGKTFQFKDYEKVTCFAGYSIKVTPKPNIIISDFLYFFMRSGSHENWKRSIFNQATIQNIGADKYSFLDVSTPPVEEQQSNVNHIETKWTRINAKVARIKQFDKTVGRI